ncbi:MAG TPA: hypothetical protein VGW33_09100 [Terriglobia bacterium]|nr:hypothetical protein [Terriglobia bacterium]
MSKSPTLILVMSRSEKSDWMDLRSMSDSFLVSAVLVVTRASDEEGCRQELSWLRNRVPAVFTPGNFEVPPLGLQACPFCAVLELDRVTTQGKCELRISFLDTERNKIVGPVYPAGTLMNEAAAG